MWFDLKIIFSRHVHLGDRASLAAILPSLLLRDILHSPGAHLFASIRNETFLRLPTYLLTYLSYTSYLLSRRICEKASSQVG